MHKHKHIHKHIPFLATSRQQKGSSYRILGEERESNVTLQTRLANCELLGNCENLLIPDHCVSTL